MDDRYLDQTTTYIPFTGDTIGTPTLPDIDGSLEEEREARFNAYRQSWSKCLERIQHITRVLLDPYASQIVEEIEDEDVLPGIPYQELPVIAVTNPTFRGTFIYDVSGRLDNPAVHLYPSDCPNSITGMRDIVSGFIEGNEETARAKHKTSTSLANYDIKLLVAWYKYFQTVNGSCTQLLVILHDFEAFIPAVMQDIFYICSQHLTDLPLVFILSLSSPVASYLNIAYPLSVLKRLRIRQLMMPGGVSVLNAILLGTFFSVEFQPDVIIGPIALQVISDFYTRCDSTLDGLITNIQLVHMKHFSIEPLTSLVYSTPDQLQEWPNVVDGLLTRLTPASKKLTAEERDQQWKSLTPSNLPKLVEAHRSEFYSRAKDVVAVFNLVKLIETFLVKDGFKGLGWDLVGGLSDILVDFLRNNVDRDVKDLNLIMRKMTNDQLKRLLPLIHEFLSNLDLEEASLEVEDLINSMEAGRISHEFSEWATSFIKSNLVSLEGNPLWEIWCTGQTPFPSELINPSIRATVVSGLLRPLDFTDTSQDVDEPLWKLPDTSILFKRYLDSGKMVNVYDWFESFQAVMEVQKCELAKTKASPKKSKLKSPKKPSAKAKGKQKQQDQDKDLMEVEQTEEEWKLEVQARFIRALHELDYLGFVKHTKRKADHVIRTVFDLND